jgi:hypothetical protein
LPERGLIAEKDERCPVATVDDRALLIGVFYNRSQAEMALGELQRGGFREDQLGVALCDAELEAPAPPARPTRGREKTAAALGAAAGGLAGVVLAVTAGSWLAGLGGAFVAGLFVVLLAGAIVVGTFLGRWAGGAAPGPASASRVEVRRLSRGIVTVRPEGRDAEAAAILCRHAGCEPRSAFPLAS